MTVQGVSGYIYADLISASNDVSVSLDSAVSSDPASIAADPASFQPADGYITASFVRLRDAPSMSANILTELSFGTTVRMT